MNILKQSGAWLLALSLFAFTAQAQEPARLRIEGIGLQAVVLTVSDLRKLKRQVLEDKRTVTRNGESHESVVRYGGVLLSDLLEQAGFTRLDPHVQRRAAIFAIASDGYQAALSWGEVFNSEAGARMLVIDEKDGAALNVEDGPIALASFADKRFGPRHVKRLLTLKVVLGVAP